MARAPQKQGFARSYSDRPPAWARAMLRPMNRRILLGSLAGVVAFVVLAAIAVPFLVPTGTLRAQIERRASEQTGRAFRINGSLSFTVFPSLGLSAGDVTLANGPGGRAPYLMRVARMRIAVKLLPLLSGRIEADRVVLDRPRIALEVARGGGANWMLSSRAGSGPHLGPTTNARFAGIDIRDGELSYDNARHGDRAVLDGLNAQISLTRLDAPAGAKGDFRYRGRALNYVLTLKTAQRLLAGRATEVNFGLTSDFLNAGFFGTVARDGTVDGAASLRTPSLKDVAAWLGHPISAGRGLGALDLRTKLRSKDDALSIQIIWARLDGMNVRGALTADLAGRIPTATGTLAFDRLDLNTYLGSPSGSGGAPHGTPAQNGGWSRAAINLDLLKLLNGRVTLNADALFVQHLRLGKTVIAATLADGLMRAHLSPMQLYGGSGEADLVVDARGPVPQFANKLTFTGIAMAPFLADTIGVAKIEGRGTIALDVAARGAAPDAIMRAMSGKGAVAIAPGAIRGVDLGRVARTVATILSAGATADNATTAFDRFAGSFAIKNGVLANTDLAMSSAFLNMTGRGTIDLGNQTIAYRIEPKASIGGRMHLLDIGVPFAIAGSWSHVRYVPDLAGAVTGLVGEVLGKGTAPIASLLGGLTGSQPGTPADKKKKKKKKNIGDTLKNMFGLH